MEIQPTLVVLIGPGPISLRSEVWKWIPAPLTAAFEVVDVGAGQNIADRLPAAIASLRSAARFQNAAFVPSTGVLAFHTLLISDAASQTEIQAVITCVRDE